MNTRIQKLAVGVMISAGFTTGFASPALAQTTAPKEVPDQVDYNGITSGGDQTATDHIKSDDLRTQALSVQLSSNDNVISAGFSYDLTLQHGSSSSNKLNSSISVVSIKASVPLNSTKDKAPVDFKTFGNDGKLTFGFNHYETRFTLLGGALSDYPKFGRVCVTQTGDSWLESLGQKDKKEERKQIADYLAAFDKLAADGYPISAILSLLANPEDSAGNNLKPSAFATKAESVCKVGGTAGITSDEGYARRYGQTVLGVEGYRRWRRQHSDPQTTWFIGAEGSVGFNRFSVADRPSLTLVQADRVGFDLNLHAGLVTGDARWVILLTGGYARSYKAKPVAEVCGPPDLSGKSTCISGQDGLPDRTDTGYATLSVRKVLFTNKDGEPVVGIRPSVTYILEDNDWQFELPVYLQRSEKGGLDAGVRVIYNSGKDKASFGAFVGVPF